MIVLNSMSLERNIVKLFALLFCLICVYNSYSQVWSDVGGGTNNSVYSLKEYNNNLYVGGWFDTVSNFYSQSIAVWNSSDWNTVGSGLYGTPYSFAVYNNELYAGGDFLYANGVLNTFHIARWNGSNWLSAGSTNNDLGQFKAMVEYNNNLYVAGDITKIGGVNVNRIAKWNGSIWSSVNGGITGGFMTQVYAMATLNNKLYVAGDFGYAGTQEAFNIASWNGTQWDALDTGLNAFAKTMTSDTMNSILYVAGNFNIVGGNNGIQVNQIAGWNENNWFNLGQGLSGNLLSMVMYHGNLYVGGEMIIVGSDSAIIYIAKWNGSQWQKVLGPNSTVFTLQVYKDTLYVGGAFTIPFNNIARYYDTLTTVTEEKKTEQEYLGNNIPNPFGTNTEIPYYLPPGSKGILTISDINGKPIKTYSLSESKNKLGVSLHGYSDGMYFYTLSIDNGRIIKHNKMILQLDK